MRLMLSVGVLCLLLSSALAAQVPPPPPPPAQHALGMQIKNAIENHRLDAFATLLGEDVELHRFGSEVVKGKQAVLAVEGARIGNADLHLSLIDGYYAAGSISFTQFYNSRATFGAIPAECCSGYDYLRFEIKDGKIRRIYNLAGGMWPLDPQGLPASQ